MNRYYRISFLIALVLRVLNSFRGHVDITFSHLETVLNQSANQRLVFFPRLPLDSRSAYRHLNRPFPSFPGPLYQNEVKYSAYDMEMMEIILMQIKFIFLRKVVHFASFWKWGFFELGSGLLNDGTSSKNAMYANE